MPGRDKTGPMGEGVLTGRGLGPCGGADPDVYGFGFGCRRGFGGRFSPFGGFGGYGGRFGGRYDSRPGGFRAFWSRPTVDRPRFWAENDKEALKEQKEFLQSRLEQINEELEK